MEAPEGVGSCPFEKAEKMSLWACIMAWEML